VYGSYDLFSIAYIVGHAAEFAFALFLLSVILSILPRKLWGVLAITIAVAITTFLSVDYIVYKQFRLHITGSMLSMFFGPASGDIFVFPKSMYITAAGALIAIVAVITGLWVLSQRLRKIPILIALFMFISLVGYNITHAWASFAEYNPITTQMTVLPITFPLSANKLLRNLGFEAPERIEQFEPQLMSYPLDNITLNAPDTPNIILIMLDGWRTDTMNEFNTPNIFEFSKGAVQFNNHNANSNHTRHGVFSIFYGLPGAYWDAAVTDTVSPVLIDTLQSLNYDFGIFASAALTSPEFHKTVFTKIPNLRLSTDAPSTILRDRKITEEFIEFLDSRDNKTPFFSFLFYDSTHAYQYDNTTYTPKFLPDKERDYLETQDKTLIFNRYRNSVGYADMLVGRALEAIEAKGIADNTIIIITGDHAEEFDDLGKGYWGHNGNYSEFQTKVPMIIRWQGKEPAVYNYRTSHIDIVPTIMQSIFHTTTPVESYTTGVNIFSSDGRKFIYMQGDEYAILTDDIITIFRKIGLLETVTERYDRTDKRVNPLILKDMMEEIGRFKR
jgi:membrane-anchored protein YejM (alkaline phosphatase superfamily)